MNRKSYARVLAVGGAVTALAAEGGGAYAAPARPRFPAFR